MSFLPRLPANARLPNLFKAFPATSKPLIEYHEALLRGPSPLSVAERELIAAFVSGLNGCSYCHGVHGATAKAFGVSEKLLSKLLDDLAESHVDERLKPILAFVKKLTLTPSRMTQADADAVFAAGWDERALHDAVSVCALFNFMNRLVEGHGLKGDAGYFLEASKRLSEHGYATLLKLLDL